MTVAWQLKDAILNPPDPDEDYDQPPDVRIYPITADWLLAQKEVGWSVAGSTGYGVKVWRALARLGHGRIGDADALPSILERCLLADHEMGGPMTEIIGSYVDLSNALKKWRALLDAKAQKRLGEVAGRLARRPDDHEATILE